MAYDEDPFEERWNKMPRVIAGFAMGGALLGGIIAAIIVAETVGIRGGGRAIIGLVSCAGFCLGLVVGVTVDTLVFKPLRENKRKRRRRRNRDDDRREAWQ
jgi:hypothetical protein